MELTVTQKLLIYEMTLFPLSEETQKAIFHSMKTEERRILLIGYLQTHSKATEEEILNEVGRIIKSTKKEHKK